MQLFDLFKFSKEIEIRDGEITLMKTPINIVPTSILSEFQKKLIDSIGFEEAYNLIYNNSKTGSKKYNDSFIQKHRFEDKRRILDWQIKIVTLAGWGKLEISYVDLTKNELIIKYSNSPFAKEYSRSNYPVCIIPAGFTAGGVTANFGVNIDAVETMCMAKGDQFCQIELGPKEFIENKKNKVWGKLGLLKP